MKDIGYARAVAEEVKLFFPTDMYPEQDAELLCEFLAPYMEYRVGLKRPEGSGKDLLPSIYWTTYSEARFVDPKNVLEKGTVHDFGFRQETSFVEACGRLKLAQKDVDQIARIMEERYVYRCAGHIQEMLREKLVESHGMARGIVMAEEVSARVLKMLRLALWDGVVHALHRRTDRVRKVAEFLRVHYYSGTMLIGCGNMGNVYVLTAPMSDSDRLTLMRNPAFS